MSGPQRFRGALGAETLTILKMRGQTLLSIVLLVSVVATVTDFLLPSSGNAWLFTTSVARLLILAGLVLVLRRASSELAIVLSAVVGVTVVVAAGTILGALRGEYSTVLLINCGMCIAAGAFLPWGWRMQLIPTLIVAVAMVFLTAQLGFEVIPPQALTLTIGCLLASVYFAVDQEATQESLARYEEGIASSYAEIDRLTDELEARSRSRSERLLAATDRLESFCASLVTDLRPRLAVVHAELTDLSSLTAGETSGEWGRLVDRIEQATLRMGATLDEMVEYVALQNAPLSVESVDLSACAARRIEALSARDPDRRVDVTIDIDQGLLVQGDPQLLGEALEQLIDNAWKFTDGRDPGLIVIGAGRRGDGLNEIIVRDNGVGFAMEHVGKLFRPFSRLEAVEAFPGHGMGLARAHRIVERHGGTLEVTASPGEGAEFRMVLPERGVA